jgi:hypothetical protein
VKVFHTDLLFKSQTEEKVIGRGMISAQVQTRRNPDGSPRTGSIHENEIAITAGIHDSVQSKLPIDTRPASQYRLTSNGEHTITVFDHYRMSRNFVKMRPTGHSANASHIQIYGFT